MIARILNELLTECNHDRVRCLSFTGTQLALLFLPSVPKPKDILQLSAPAQKVEEEASDFVAGINQAFDAAKHVPEGADLTSL